ncbi:MAG: YoaK family protein [Sphingobium sp.]
MIRHDRHAQRLAICLAMLAGFVDAVGFLKLGGLFVSFMSGNSTRLAVGLSEGSSFAWRAALLITAFVVGVVGGSLLPATKNRPRAVLAMVAALLLAAALADLLGMNNAAIGAMALAMGCANTVFQRDGEVSIGVTYMTGTLVKLGQRIADALRGGAPTAWIPYLLLWLGLVAGAVAGSIGYMHAGLASLWIAATGAALLAVLARPGAVILDTQ